MIINYQQSYQFYCFHCFGCVLEQTDAQHRKSFKFIQFLAISWAMGGGQEVGGEGGRPFLPFTSCEF